MNQPTKKNQQKPHPALLNMISPFLEKFIFLLFLLGSFSSPTENHCIGGWKQVQKAYWSNFIP